MCHFARIVCTAVAVSLVMMEVIRLHCACPHVSNNGKGFKCLFHTSRLCICYIWTAVVIAARIWLICWTWEAHDFTSWIGVALSNKVHTPAREFISQVTNFSTIISAQSVYLTLLRLVSGVGRLTKHSETFSHPSRWNSIAFIGGIHDPPFYTLIL